MRRHLIGLWLAVHAVLVVRGAVTGAWPWSMFAHPPGRDYQVHAAGRVGDGDWQDLPIDTLFHYRRGTVDRTLLDEVKALKSPRGNRRERERFAQWAVVQLAPDRGYTEVRLWRTSRHTRTGDERVLELGTFEVGP